MAAATRIHRSQVERVYGEIRARILDGRLKPGAPLAEVALATSHGTSRTPVREVLSRLHEEGWVERVPRRGFFVARIALRALRDMFEVRRLLEGHAAAEAAVRATPPERRRLEELIAEETQPPGPKSRRPDVINREFHHAVAMASHNQFAVDLTVRCLAQMDRVLALGQDWGSIQQGSTEEHRAIVDAIARQDADAARRRMEEHLDRCAALLREALVTGIVEDIGA